MAPTTAPSWSPVTYTTPVCPLQHLAGQYLEVPPAIVQQLGGRINQRVICTVNNTLTFQAGLVALGQGAAYINFSAQRMKALRVQLGDTVRVRLEKDSSTFGLAVPEELSALLEQDEAGNQRFQKLTPGKQRYIIQYVAAVKHSQLRIDRAILLIENLKRLPVGKESFREMLGLPPR